MHFKNAKEAFEWCYDEIMLKGINFSGTKALFNVGFTIEDPSQRNINTGYRTLPLSYAQAEWKWYLSGDPNAEEIAKTAKIWLNHMDEDGNVRSNYGWQWKRNGQLDKVVQMLKDNPETRQATISIYDGKEIDTYQYDTPCTYAIGFQIVNNKLCMSVYMRSNDLWVGFLTDQYCFSMLQEMVADRLGIEMGWYYHSAQNLHIYNRHVGAKEKRTWSVSKVGNEFISKKTGKCQKIELTNGIGDTAYTYVLPQQVGKYKKGQIFYNIKKAEGANWFDSKQLK